MVAVVNRSEKSNLKGLEAAGEGCRAYTTLQDALRHEKIDLVDVCTPTHTHEAFVVEAAKAGCHVLCEKPVTLEMESLERMLAACEKSGVRFHGRAGGALVAGVRRHQGFRGPGQARAGPHDLRKAPGAGAPCGPPGACSRRPAAAACTT